MKYLGAVAILLCCSGAAGADIIGWQDADGVSHYTNLKSTIPKEQEGATHVVVDEVARQQAPSAAAAVSEEPAAQKPEPQDKTQVVGDPPDLTDAYVRGLLHGLETAGSVAGAGGGGSVQISGPLTVVNATTTEPFYDYSNPWLYSPWLYPLGFSSVATTGFRGGRLHHGNRRLMPHDGFAIDRSASFFFQESVIPPAGRPPLGAAGRPPLGVGVNPLVPRASAAGGSFSQATHATFR